MLWEKSTISCLNGNNFKDLMHAYKLNTTQFQHVTYTLRTRYAHVTPHVTPYRI